MIRKLFIQTFVVMLLATKCIFSQNLSGTPLKFNAGIHKDCGLRIIIDGGVGEELLINFFENKLEFITPERLNTNNGFYIDGCKYYIDWGKIDKNYSKYNAENKLKLTDGKLYFESQLIKFPGKVRIKDVWQAVGWKNWVLILGRTSESDDIAKLTPPFFATEFFAFSIKKKKVDFIKFLDSFPPPGNRIWILEPQSGK